jgi:hypothetical protein
MRGNRNYRWAMTKLLLKFSKGIPLINPQSWNPLVFSDSKLNSCKCRKHRELTFLCQQEGQPRFISKKKQKFCSSSQLHVKPRALTESVPGLGGTIGRGVNLIYHHPYLDLTFIYLFRTFLPSLLSSAYISSYSTSVIWFPIYETSSSGGFEIRITPFWLVTPWSLVDS